MFSLKKSLFFASILLFLSVLTLAPTNAAQRGQKVSVQAMIPLRAGEEISLTRVRPSAELHALNAPRTAQIIVNYHGFSPDAQAAFQRAVDIWETQISSPVPIVVDAHWEPLGAGVLGAAGFDYALRDFPGAPRGNTLYPPALANALSGTDLVPEYSDITAYFNSDFTAWYMGLDGNTPAGSYDFVTVVLHEIGHGLGFAGSMQVQNGQGGWGAGTGSPFIYDHFARNGAGASLIDTSRFPNPSTALANELQSNSVFFNGENTNGANGGTQARLYAPGAWEQGSSYSHFEEFVYVPGHPDSLMTPYLDQGESIHDPGSLARGLFRDLGWNTGGQVEPTPTPAPTHTPAPTATPDPTLTEKLYLPLSTR